jgi:hypothetical protein
MAFGLRLQVKVFGEVKLTQAALLSAVVAVGLKSLVENIRLQTLGRAGEGVMLQAIKTC